MERLELDYKNSKVSLIRFGSGSRIALCFHGYGENANHFQFLDQHAGNQFTFYSFDLPFHGQTQWNDGLNFSPADLEHILVRLSNKEGFELRNLTLIGFSMGGRVILSLYQKAPDRVSKMVLMAPDGLKVNFWYWLSTQTLAGNRIFRYTMKHPTWFFRALKILSKIGLVNSSIFKFVNYYIGEKQVREDLYKRWTLMRKIKPSVKKIKSLIHKYNTPVGLIYGKFDRIIVPSVGEKFRKGIEDQCSLHVILSGHQILHEKHIGEILPVLLK